jgi:uncharacterized membrane protein required for colicin V production
MNYLDGIFLAVMCVFCFFGFRSGILRRGVAVVFLVVGLVLATRTMHTLGAILTDWWNVHEVVGAVLAFVLVIFVTVMAAIIIIAIMSRYSQPPRLWSRLSGVVIGLAEITLYLSLLLVVLNIYSLPTQQTREKSVLYRPVRNFAPFVFDKTNAIFSGSTSFDEELKRSFEKFRLIPSD